MKKIYITLKMLFVLVMANAQNWSYVGSQNFSAGTTLGAYKYFGDMEIDATGNIYVGYWDNGDKINFVKSNGNGWTVLPTPGLCSVLNILDVEVQGSNLYISYMGVRGTNLYAFVKKYDGTSSWSFIGDSLLIGGTGQGGSFDFLLDNNGIPTIIGLPDAVFGNKNVKQFVGGVWTKTYVIPNTTSTIFKEGSAIFDANNKLNCVVSGIKTLNAAPWVLYYTLGLKIDGNSSAIVGDSIYASQGNGKFKIDNTGNSYLLLNNALKPSLLAYKLNGTKWDIISDTVGTTENMVNAAVTNDGKVIFNTFSITNLHKSLYVYNGKKRTKMDTLNYNSNIFFGINDLIIYNGDVYALIEENGFSVMKHSATNTGTSFGQIESNFESINIFPNPTKHNFTINMNSNNEFKAEIININGQNIFEKTFFNSTEIDCSFLQQGIYFIKIISESNENIYKKIMIE